MKHSYFEFDLVEYIYFASDLVDNSAQHSHPVNGSVTDFFAFLHFGSVVVSEEYAHVELDFAQYSHFETRPIPISVEHFHFESDSALYSVNFRKQILFHI